MKKTKKNPVLLIISEALMIAKLFQMSMLHTAATFINNL